jgi:CheY-like chemotaxis protein
VTHGARGSRRRSGSTRAEAAAGGFSGFEGHSMDTVLIVEDDISNMQVFSLLLSSWTYNVLEATTGQEAIDSCSRYHGQLHLLLTDLTLPDLSGTDVALKVLQFHRETVILFVSGTPLENWTESDLLKLRTLTPGAADFLEKPFLASSLQSKIESLTKRRPDISPDFGIVGHGAVRRDTVLTTLNVKKGG